MVICLWIVVYRFKEIMFYRKWFICKWKSNFRSDVSINENLTVDGFLDVSKKRLS